MSLYVKALPPQGRAQLDLIVSVFVFACSCMFLWTTVQQSQIGQTEFFLFLSTEMSWESHLHLLHEIASCCQLLSGSRQKCMCACVCMLVFVWLCVHLLHSATHTSMYAINDAKLFTYIEYLSCVDVPSQLCRPTQRLRNMKMLLHSLSLWTASYKQAHIDTSATCMPTCVNTCVHTNTSTLLQIFYVCLLGQT